MVQPESKIETFIVCINLQHMKGYPFSGSSAFTIDLWGKKSDPFLQATLFCAYFGGMGCVQLAKLFLAERQPELDTDWSQNNFTSEIDGLQLFDILNTTDLHKHFQSDVEHVYFIVGALCIAGTVMLIFTWFHSGCQLTHWLQGTEREAISPSVQSGDVDTLTKCCLFVASFLLCLITFLGIATEESFISFGITFAVNILGWTKNDATNLVTVFFVSELMSLCVSIVLSKFANVHKLMGFSILTSFAGALIMTLTLKVTSFSLWIGASLLGLGMGNLVANNLNAGRRLTSQASVISLILASKYISRMTAPLLIGSLFEYVDAMWNLYLCVVCSGSMLLLSLLFCVVLLCRRKFESQQACDIPLEEMMAKGQHGN